MQNTIQIGNIIRSALVFNINRWNGSLMATDELFADITRLFALLQEQNIQYLLVGGIAMLKYIKGRNTEDIDLIVSLHSIEKLPEIAIISQDENFARCQLNTLQIDFLLTRNPLFAYVQANCVTSHDFGEQKISCATVEGLMLLKLYALPSLYRQGDFARVGLYENDIATLINAYHPSTSGLLSQLTPYLIPSDIASIQEILAEIQKRIARFHKK